MPPHSIAVNPTLLKVFSFCSLILTGWLTFLTWIAILNIESGLGFINNGLLVSRSSVC